MPAPSASTPFLPNLNQHLVLEPFEGPIPEEDPTQPSLILLLPLTNLVLNLGRAGGEEVQALGVKAKWVVEVVHGIEAILSSFPKIQLLN